MVSYNANCWYWPFIRLRKSSNATTHISLFIQAYETPSLWNFIHRMKGNRAKGFYFILSVKFRTPFCVHFYPTSKSHLKGSEWLTSSFSRHSLSTLRRTKMKLTSEASSGSASWSGGDPSHSFNSCPINDTIKTSSTFTQQHLWRTTPALGPFLETISNTLYCSCHWSLISQHDLILTDNYYFEKLAFSFKAEWNHSAQIFLFLLKKLTKIPQLINKTSFKWFFIWRYSTKLLACIP